ncbi:MAG: hypothetical protein M3P01_12870 [Actinomycetota bacterium]|nr:hypothetical protein [Actinomycetota bacterium]
MIRTHLEDAPLQMKPKRAKECLPTEGTKEKAGEERQSAQGEQWDIRSLGKPG